MAMFWYVVHTYSGYEAKAKLALEQRMKAAGKEGLLEEVLIPSEPVEERVKGQKRITNRKFYPGYILVKMELNDDTWHIVKGTPRITGFVGSSRNPPSVPEDEVTRITDKINEGTIRPKPKVEFEKGESIRVTEGPFAGFAGIVEDVKPEKGKLRVLVSIFGRATPVELEFFQVEKA